jgi:hypothetical protein
MPATGCPCRAIISWTVAVLNITNHNVDFWVSDGSHTFRSAPVFGQTADLTGASQTITSTVTYANSATPTFTLMTQGASGANYTVEQAPAVGAGANFGIDISVVTSN